MTETTTPITQDGSVGSFTTPAGIQSTSILKNRRLIMAALNIGTFLLLTVLMAGLLGQGGWTLLDGLMMLSFLVAAPWSVLGFWNAVVGLWLLHGVKDGLERVAPFVAVGDDKTPIVSRTAILMTLRNEDPARAFARLRAVEASLDRTGEGAHFAFFVLSDTQNEHVARLEELHVEQWRTASAYPDRIHYRRRAENIGYKAGNVRDFCARWGGDYEFMLPLDADSLMDGETILKLVRIMQAFPKLGLLQSLVVGAPSQSAFARLFQFGMRHGMRSYTMGSAFWAGDCGPFWGHNAIVRIKPFYEDCHLPVIPGGKPFGGHVLSHDQVEAVLMRRAGYEVRVLPIETGSWEDNPPTVLEFTGRDLRWCQGNLQYLKLFPLLPKLLPMNLFQLVWAVLMFIGIPGWTVMLACAALKPFDSDIAAGFNAPLAIALYAVFLLMYLAPKLAGFCDILFTRGEVKRYGGALRFATGCIAELIFSFLLGAIATFRVCLFMIGLIFGKSVIWNGQARDAHRLPWAVAWQGLWPQTLFGVVITALMAIGAPSLILWSLPLIAGFWLAIPFAVVSSDPALGRFFARLGLCALPEELAEPQELRDIRVTTAIEAGAAT
jgi:membrane glycosyltransferase